MPAQIPPDAPQALSLVAEPPAIGSRALFPRLQQDVYLAHAAISPASSVLEAAVQACTRKVAEVGVGSFPFYMGQRERLRASAAGLFNVSKDYVGLTGGCTKGINDLALALPWKSTDTLITYHGEFPANVSPWQVAATARGAQVEILELPSPRDVDCAQQIVDRLEARLKRGGVTYLAVSAVQFQTGLRMPIRRMGEVCRAHGVRLFVDGIQACGIVPFDLADLRVDAYFVGAHKWLLGLEGVGLAYYSPDLLSDLRPQTTGWLSYPDAEKFLFSGAGHLRYDRPLLSAPNVFEGSTMNVVGFVALETGIDTLLHLGVSSIYEHVQSYHDAVEPQLSQLGFQSLRAQDPELRSGILTFVPPDGVDVTTLAPALRQRGITISIPDGLVRLSPHYANSLDEVDQVVGAFRDLLRN